MLVIIAAAVVLFAALTGGVVTAVRHNRRQARINVRLARYCAR